jgi:hypothetical protein
MTEVVVASAARYWPNEQTGFRVTQLPLLNRYVFALQTVQVKPPDTHVEQFEEQAPQESDDVVVAAAIKYCPETHTGRVAVHTVGAIK